MHLNDFFFKYFKEIDLKVQNYIINELNINNIYKVYLYIHRYYLNIHIFCLVKKINICIYIYKSIDFR